MKTIKAILKFILFIISIIVAINIYIYIEAKSQITTLEELKEHDENIDCILVLGAGIRSNEPSPMLKDRLDTSINLYENKISKKILVSGDHQSNDYDEVSVMKKYLLKNNIESENIFKDHYGISTYDSIYRTKKIYKANHVVIVTQKYHIYRALYIAKQLDIKAYGIISEGNNYAGQNMRTLREFFASIKDFIKCIIKPESTYLGKVHYISSSGEETDERD